MVLLIMGGITCKWQWQRSESFGFLADKICLKLPVIGKIWKYVILSRCLQTLGLLLKAGLPIMEALQITAKVANHRFYSREFTKMSQQVALGQTLNSAFTETLLFPSRVRQFVSLGEESGTLDRTLDQLAEYFTEQVDHRIAMFNHLLEPLLMVVLSGIIGSLVIAMYLPIFRLGTIL